MALIGAQFVQAVQPVPVGSLQAFAGANTPTGWLLCDGTSYSTSVYPNLFSVLGYTYGGSGANFNVPDLRGRMPIGPNSDSTAANTATRSVGTKGGDTRLQSHTHPVALDPIDARSQYSGTSDAGNAFGAGDGNVAMTYWANGGTYRDTQSRESGTGSGQNMPPFLVTNYIIKALPDVPRQGMALGTTPPIVTTLPANPQYGEQVTLLVTSPYTGYQSLQYNGSSWVTLDDSRGVGAWQSWTPAVYQNGTRTISNIVSRYMQTGKTVHVNALLQVTNAGTTVQPITWSLPVGAINPSNGYVAGVFNYSRASGIRYMGSWSVNNGFGGQTTAQVSGTVNQLGIDPAFATANGDYLSFSGTYEAA
jgi:microcystin-dependent protein